jgi:hypothetical protein
MTRRAGPTGRPCLLFRHGVPGEGRQAGRFARPCGALAGRRRGGPTGEGRPCCWPVRATSQPAVPPAGLRRPATFCRIRDKRLQVVTRTQPPQAPRFLRASLAVCEVLSHMRQKVADHGAGMSVPCRPHVGGANCAQRTKWRCAGLRPDMARRLSTRSGAGARPVRPTTRPRRRQTSPRGRTRRGGASRRECGTPQRWPGAAGPRRGDAQRAPSPHQKVNEAIATFRRAGNATTPSGQRPNVGTAP